MLLILNLLTTRITAPTLLLLYILPQLTIHSGLTWWLKIIIAEGEVLQCSRSHSILQSYPDRHELLAVRPLQIRIEKGEEPGGRCLAEIGRRDSLLGIISVI